MVPQPSTHVDIGKSETDFLVKDYELKIRYLSDHFSRMWNRFNYFVAIESALISGKFLLGNGKVTKEWRCWGCSGVCLVRHGG